MIDPRELAYGLLWIAGCDRTTEHGQALSLARHALLETIDKDGQARGIAAAREALKANPPLKRSELDIEGVEKCL